MAIIVPSHSRGELCTVSKSHSQDSFRGMFCYRPSTLVFRWYKRATFFCKVFTLPIRLMTRNKQPLCWHTQQHKMRHFLSSFFPSFGSARNKRRSAKTLCQICTNLHIMCQRKQWTCSANYVHNVRSIPSGEYKSIVYRSTVAPERSASTKSSSKEARPLACGPIHLYISHSTNRMPSTSCHMEKHCT